MGMQFDWMICAQALARGHARSGDRVAIAAYLGSSDRFDNAIAEFAESCAEQNVKDHAKLRRAADVGRVMEVPGSEQIEDTADLIGTCQAPCTAPYLADAVGRVRTPDGDRGGGRR
mgnify:CR=1 FL=1